MNVLSGAIAADCLRGFEQDLRTARGQSKRFDCQRMKRGHGLCFVESSDAPHGLGLRARPPAGTAMSTEKALRRPLPHWTSRLPGEGGDRRCLSGERVDCWPTNRLLVRQSHSLPRNACARRARPAAIAFDERLRRSLPGVIVWALRTGVMSDREQRVARGLEHAHSASCTGSRSRARGCAARRRKACSKLQFGAFP